MDLQQTDYYRFSWTVVNREEWRKSSKVIFFGWLVVVGFFLELGAMVLNQATGVKTNEFFWLLSLVVLIFLIILGIFWKNIKLSRGGSVIKYNISRSGITINDKVYDISEFNRQKTLENIIKEKDADISHGVEVVLKYGNRIKLLFDNTDTKAKVIRGMERYLASV
jgi:hypothetical protein